MTTLTVDLEEYPEFKTWQDGESYDLLLTGVQKSSDSKTATLTVESLEEEGGGEEDEGEAEPMPEKEEAYGKGKKKMPRALMIIAGK